MSVEYSVSEMLLDVIQLILGGVLVVIYRPLLRLVEATRDHAAATNDAVNHNHPHEPKLKDRVDFITDRVTDNQSSISRINDTLDGINMKLERLLSVCPAVRDNDTSKDCAE